MKRSDKGKALVRYITGHTGIPMLHFDGRDNSIAAPNPYSIKVITDTHWWRFSEQVRAANDQSGIPFVIRYDGYIQGVDNAIVGTNLRSFAQLLEAYENTIRRGGQ